MDFSAEISYVRFALSRARPETLPASDWIWCRGVEMWRGRLRHNKRIATCKETDKRRMERSVRGAGEWNVSEMNIEFIEGFDFGGCLRELWEVFCEFLLNVFKNFHKISLKHKLTFHKLKLSLWLQFESHKALNGNLKTFSKAPKGRFEETVKPSTVTIIKSFKDL